MYLRVYIWNSLICIHDPFVQFEWWKHCLNTAVDRRKFALDFCMETPSYYQSSQHRWIVTFKIYSYLSKQHWAKYLDKMVHCIVRYRCIQVWVSVSLWVEVSGTSGRVWTVFIFLTVTHKLIRYSNTHSFKVWHIGHTIHIYSRRIFFLKVDRS